MKHTVPQQGRQQMEAQSSHLKVWPASSGRAKGFTITITSHRQFEGDEILAEPCVARMVAAGE